MTTHNRKTTLSQCFTQAEDYWESVAPGSAAQQSTRAKVCVEIVGAGRSPGTLTGADAAKLLKGLNDRGLSRKSVVDYYSTFKRMLVLNDETPQGFARWPKAATPPRKSREAITKGDFEAAISWLRRHNFEPTADLAVLLNAIGGRVQREVLLRGNLRYRTRDGELLVFITGKGGHEREIPVTCKAAQAIIKDRPRYNAVLAVPYRTHLWRWNRAREELGIKGLATFHAIRHKYATEVLGKTKNLRLVQKLLGHSNPATTAIYADVGLDEMVKALKE